MIADDLAFETIDALGARLRRGTTTAVELATYFLDRLARLGPALGCVATITRDLAFDQAAWADAQRRAGSDLGPLHGIPYGVKDLFATRGIPTTWGAAPFQGRVIDEDAAVVEHLRAAGAVLVAKLATIELAGAMDYERADACPTGPCRNPWKPSRWAGGSSSGPGAAVAAGLVPFAIGTETWGSITTPASYCGVAGLRPTYGRVSRRGAMALAWSHDKVGPMARSARDCGLVLAAIAGRDEADPASVDLPLTIPEADFAHALPYKLAVLRDDLADAHPDVKANFERAVGVLRTLGTVEAVDLPDLPFDDVASTIVGAEGAAAFEEMMESGSILGLTAPEDRVGGFADMAIPAVDYLRAQRLRPRLARALDAFFAPFDAVLSPATADTAPAADGAFGDRRSARSMGGPGNVCGTPALVVPTGLSADGLPTSIQLDGRAFSEGTLLGIAASFQRSTPWHRARPPMG